MLEQIANSAMTSIGFFWKAGWAFVLGYFISSMIQAFVPKVKMVKYMGDSSFKSVGLGTIFGAISSSCSFAALSAGRSLFRKGASFASTLAFLFASTNLVIELGILIYVFLGWQYVIAEIIGGIILILITWGLVSLFYPKKLVEEARSNVGEDEMEDSFNWKEKIKTKEGWYQVGHEFAHNWQMVWKEITIGFTLAGIMATYVPNETWKAIFLVGQADIGFWQLLENTLIAPVAAMLTFIGSMGNIPISTILASSGVTFAGIMAFIYSDLVVPPIVAVNKKYYGWKTALYIAGVFYVSIVITALLLHLGFASVGMLPEGANLIMKENPFKINYTFWFNIVFLFIAGIGIYLNKKFKEQTKHHHMMDMEGDSKAKTVITWICISYVFIGFLSNFIL
ncbi:membrane protein [Paraliobacillus quinghaiensis]|uniref:Membrane protein n=1 Tax=Paraliobacillus quinghaiensis TaxID=470815 RepID=A0A917TW07_9BACI|nr:permease [Paraliobacillus quinghaiensis]GGM38162.1 membrane protein [Paraliobacillus quinghaiensis]